VTRKERRFFVYLMFFGLSVQDCKWKKG